MRDLKVALIQMSPSADRGDNLAQAARFLDRASEAGAHLAVLPEMFSLMCPPRDWRSGAEPAGGPTEEFLAGKAREGGLHIVGGSYVESAGEGAFYNTSTTFGPDGSVIGRYRKMHLFWTRIEGETRYDERSWLSAGDERYVWEIHGFNVMVGICYDLRFPEFFRVREGGAVDLYCLPAAFMATTGKAHWRVLARARAIENLAYFAGAATVGKHYEVEGRPGESVTTYGHSMFVSPWGEVEGTLESGEGVLFGEVKRDEIEAARGRLAALEHTREQLWRQ